MSENPPTIEANRPSIHEQIAEIFNRREERLNLKDAYKKAFEVLVETLAPEDRDRVMVKLQKFGISVRGTFAEYGSRFCDFVRNTVSWPLAMADSSYPKDKYYQMERARAEALMRSWARTLNVATTERKVLRDNFLAAAVTGGAYGSIAGAAVSVLPAIGVGIKYGALAGAAAGVEGAAIGAGIGGLIGGMSSLVMRIKDKIMGPPVAQLNDSFVVIGAGSIRSTQHAGGRA